MELMVQQKYKCTEVGVLPEDWIVKKLTQISTMKSGNTITARSINTSGRYPVYGGNGLRGYSSTFTHTGTYAIIGRQGALCGNVTLVNGDFFASEHAVVVTPKAGTDIIWLSFVLERMNLNQYSESTAQPGLSVQKIIDLPIAVPPAKDEQTKIASALSDIDAFITCFKKLIEKKRQIKQGAMQELLKPKKGWSKMKIGEFTKVVAGGTPSTAIPGYWGGNIKWMSSGELHLKNVLDVEKTITQLGFDNSSTQLLPSGCVLIGLAGQGKTRGTVAINYIELCTNQSIAAIYPNKIVLPEFLYFYLDIRYDELRSLSTGDGGRGGLNIGIIKNIEISFPSPDNQQGIVCILSDIDAEIDTLERKLVKYNNIKQGMMHMLLTGKVRLL